MFAKPTSIKRKNQVCDPTLVCPLGGEWHYVTIARINRNFCFSIDGVRFDL